VLHFTQDSCILGLFTLSKDVPMPPQSVTESVSEVAPSLPSYSVSSQPPDTFCWTKMHAESGQTLEAIVTRKEAERCAGAGIFFWGVGNSLGKRLDVFLQRTREPKVAFSVMRSRPKPEDAAPDEVLVWTACMDSTGTIRPLPRHVLLLSRKSTAAGEKRRHYALVCRSNEPLTLGPRGSLHLGQFQNLGSRTPKVGASQVTTILERHGKPGDGLTYNIDLLADLVDPHFVRLAKPRILTAAQRDQITRASTGRASINDWLRLVSEVRAAGRVAEPEDSPSLFD
jgi:hypothetical protein